MATSYTSILRLAKPATGELDGTWGTVLNDNVTSMLEEAIAGLATVAMADANQTLTTANGTTDQSRCAMIECTGALTDHRNVVCPTASKLYIVNNKTTGSKNIVFKTAAGTGVTVLPGTVAIVYCDATNVVSATTGTIVAAATGISGIIGSANGGTGNGYTKFTGPTTSEKTFTLPDADTTVVGTTTTQTLTNKRVTPRILSAASYTTDTGTSLNCDNLDEFIVTAQAGALKFNNPTGTPTDGQVLLIAVTGTAARALTWDTQFEASTVALPSTTVTTARLSIGFIWRADTSKWVCVGVS